MILLGRHGARHALATWRLPVSHRQAKKQQTRTLADSNSLRSRPILAEEAQDRMPDVFLSYAREDKAKAAMIADKLQSAGFSVWWDRDILPGKQFEEVIGAALDAASSVVVLWSSVSTQSDWVRDEADRGRSRKVLIPALIENVTPPLGYRQVQTADLSAWNGEATDPAFTQICDAISGLVKSPSGSGSGPGDTTKPAPRVPSVATPPPSPPPPQPVASPQFFLGRWRWEGFNAGTDIVYLPDGTFNGMMVQNMAGYPNRVNVFGRWNLQPMAPNIFQLQLWFANFTTWGGTFQILDANHIQNLESNYIATRVL